jgi:hypothetical protein
LATGYSAVRAACPIRAWSFPSDLAGQLGILFGARTPLGAKIMLLVEDRGFRLPQRYEIGMPFSRGEVWCAIFKVSQPWRHTSGK